MRIKVFTVFSVVLLALVVSGLELLPEPALLYQLLLVVGLRVENIHQMRKCESNTDRITMAGHDTNIVG